MIFEKQTNSTVEEYMTKWLVNTKRPTLKRSSYDRVEQSLNCQIFPVIGGIKLKKLTCDDIQMMLNDLSERTSFSTTKKAYVNLKSCLDLAVIKGDIKKNPMLTVVLPKNNKPDETVVYYSPEQARAIASEAVSKYRNGNYKYRYGYIIVLLLNTGLRLGEVLALSWSDVDFSNRVLYVHNSVATVKARGNSSTKYETIVNSPKSRKSIRYVPLNMTALDALVKIHSIMGDNERVVTTDNCKYVKPGNIHRTMERILKNCGIYGKRDIVHALRHTFATLLLRQGTDIKVVSEILGHSDVSVTMKFYYHIIEEQKKTAMTKLDEIY
ncbi:tyrosine-type recombinase/integrase [Ruminococcus albus]|uniref:Site-specific recombinase XerD n=1 Tax=Ruminococcus albus TaxID=1264 RepID=A0A1I1RK30_RUMAL|nr:site-specific integrase [Ruminococcus albus]SFD32668.1 Site-specific recombinase XerD [Ruminococcus albus]